MKVVFPDGNDYVGSLIESEQLTKPEGFVFFSDVPADQEELHERIKEAEAVLFGWTKLKKETLAGCRKLRFICFLGTGAASYIDIREATNRGIVVNSRPI
jgi:phosphoglycerate dehydrogenase-like enzyme